MKNSEWRKEVRELGFLNSSFSILYSSRLLASAAVRDALAERGSVSLVRFVLWGDQAMAAYTQAAQGLGLVPEG